MSKKEFVFNDSGFCVGEAVTRDFSYCKSCQHRSFSNLVFCEKCSSKDVIVLKETRLI